MYIILVLRFVHYTIIIIIIIRRRENFVGSSSTAPKNCCRGGAGDDQTRNFSSACASTQGTVPPGYEQALSTVDTPALMDAIQELTSRVESLDGLVVNKHSNSTMCHQSGHHRPVVCHRCGCSGHYARGCASKQPNQDTANNASSSSGQEAASQTIKLRWVLK